VDIEKVPAYKNILNVRGLSTQIRLDILDVVESIRPGARVIVRPGAEASFAAELILSYGLAISVGRGMVRIPLASEAFFDYFSKEQDIFEKMAVFYLAGTQSMSDSLRAADESAEDSKFGLLLGYPKCCIEFVKSRQAVPKLSETVSLYSHLSKYDPLIWPASAVLDGALLPHFPCSNFCVHSKSIAKKRWNLIRNGSLELAAHIASANSKTYWIEDGGALRVGDRLPDQSVYSNYASPVGSLDIN
jgi:hypothetical protein